MILLCTCRFCSLLTQFLPRAPHTRRVCSWQNDVKDFVAARERELYANRQHGMPIFEKNWIALSYQLQTLRCGTRILKALEGSASQVLLRKDRL